MIKLFFPSGQVPPESFIIKLVAWLKVNSEQVIFHSDNMPQLFPEAKAFRKICSGVLACRINRELEEYMIWFRPEIITTIQWAGNPEKPALTNPLDIMQISPRTSFDVWSQEVQMTSAAWTVEEMDSAMQLREEVNFTINRKASELRILNEKLKIAYDELNTFSHTVSHDLRNPLSSVKGFIELLLMEEETLTEDMKFILGRVLANANKMESMIQEILKYSKAGALPVTRAPVEYENHSGRNKTGTDHWNETSGTGDNHWSYTTGSWRSRDVEPDIFEHHRQCSKIFRETGQASGHASVGKMLKMVFSIAFVITVLE